MHSKAAESTTTAPSSTGNGSQPVGSRSQFELYRRKVKQKELTGGSLHSTGETRSAKDRVRPAKELVWQFLKLLSPFRRQIVLILVSLTASPAIGLLPPAGSKF